MNEEQIEIHAAKLPSTVPLEDLLIRPRDGVTVDVEPTRAGWRYLSFRALALADGESTSLAHPEQEAMVVTISGGGVRIEIEGSSPIDLPGRTSVFDALPWSAYIPAGSLSRIVGRPMAPDGRAVVAYAQAPASGRPGVTSGPILIDPDDVQVEIRGAGQATRQVNNIALGDFPADRLMACEVFTPGGNWSGWPPHKHDVDDMPREAVLEEVYYYKLARTPGWGVARIYFRDGRKDAVWAVQDGDCLLVTEGYHPFAANPGYDAYYLNFLAGDRRTMQASDDPDIAWIRETWRSMKPDPRMPLVPRAPIGSG